VELWESIADDKAIDLEAWIDSKLWLARCPKRLVEIASKRAKGEALKGSEQNYMGKYRKKYQKTLF